MGRISMVLDDQRIGARKNPGRIYGDVDPDHCRLSKRSRPLMHPIPRAPFTPRFFFFALLLCTSGCGLFRGGLEVPESWPEPTLRHQLTEPDHRSAAYRQLFPALSKIHVLGADFTASSRWWPGHKRFMVNLLAIDRDNLRLRGYVPQATLFDLILRRGHMTVLLFDEGRVFAFVGVPDRQASPFGRHFGVEPGDLIPILSIGQLLARGELTPVDSRGLELRPSSPDGADGLMRVELDAASGLPAHAVWQRGDRDWQVDYQAWRFFDAPNAKEPPLRRLMPAEIAIASDGSSIHLHAEMNRYRFGDMIPPRLFALTGRQPERILPLEELDNVFEDL